MQVKKIILYRNHVEKFNVTQRKKMGYFMIFF